MTSVCYVLVCVHLVYSFHQSDLLLSSITVENQYEYLANKITPYCKLTYDEQLERKQNSCSVFVDSIVKRSGNLKNLMTYKILKIINSTVTKEYRNKDEFDIRCGVDGNVKTVGCPFGSKFSVHPTTIVTMKESHKLVAQVYEDFIRLSPLPPSLIPYDGGHWNSLIVRSNEVGEIMACVIVKSKGIPYHTIIKHQLHLKEYFLKHLPNITLYHQVCKKKRCTEDIAPFILLYGKQYIEETLNGRKFFILPGATFPVNKFGAEVFYDTIIRIAELKRYTIVLDIFSGTGMNGIVISKSVRRVLGFETIRPAVTAARKLIDLNGIRNVKFLVGMLYKNLNSTLHLIQPKTDVVVFLNHRYSGLGYDIIRTIRQSVIVSRIVYLFYRPNAPNDVSNFEELCSDKYPDAPPFQMTKVIPIDLLPQTKHVEIILIFQREPV